jgi:glycosyltransferase involved in cell wall biosynthesis
LKFYVFTPGFHVRPRNTDWVYNRMLPQISRFDPEVQIYLQRSLSKSLEYNARFVIHILKSRANFPAPRAWLPDLESPFDLDDLRRSGADVIYGHSPTNVTHMPLICSTGPHFEAAMRASGLSEEEIAIEKEQKARAIRRSQLTTLHSQTAADSLLELAGDRADRIRVLPFFLPHLQLLNHEEIERKFAALTSPESRVKLLFVGRESRRKGLPVVLEAFQALDARFPGRLELEVVSNLADGPLKMPPMPNLTLTGETSREDIIHKMRKAHVMLMPSRFETFGWVYLEAMASGTIALASNQPPQREILANGTAGLLVGPTGEDIVSALAPLIAESGAMLHLALRGQQRVAEEYDPYVVARKFREFGEEAKVLFQADRGIS